MVKQIAILLFVMISNIGIAQTKIQEGIFGINIHKAGVDSTYVEIDSPHGHDAFLINFDQVGAPIKTFLERTF